MAHSPTASQLFFGNNKLSPNKSPQKGEEQNHIHNQNGDILINLTQFWEDRVEEVETYNSPIPSPSPSSPSVPRGSPEKYVPPILLRRRGRGQEISNGMEEVDMLTSTSSPPPSTSSPGTSSSSTSAFSSPSPNPASTSTGRKNLSSQPFTLYYDNDIWTPEYPQRPVKTTDPFYNEILRRAVQSILPQED